MSQKLWYACCGVCISLISFYLFGIQKIGYFINSQYYWWLLISMVFVFICSAIFLFFIFRNSHVGKKVKNSQYVFSLLLLTVVTSLFILPIKPLSSESAAYSKRVVVKQDTKNAKYIAKSPDTIGSLSLIDWTNLITLSTNPAQYNGQKISIKGFVSSPKKGVFDLSLYQVSCCVVDAQFYSIPVISDESYDKDTWLIVKGTLEISGQKPNVIYNLKATNIEKTPPPADPYQSK